MDLLICKWTWLFICTRCQSITAADWQSWSTKGLTLQGENQEFWFLSLVALEGHWGTSSLAWVLRQCLCNDFGGMLPIYTGVSYRESYRSTKTTGVGNNGKGPAFTSPFNLSHDLMPLNCDFLNKFCLSQSVFPQQRIHNTFQTHLWKQKEQHGWGG